MIDLSHRPPAKEHSTDQDDEQRSRSSLRALEAPESCFCLGGQKGRRLALSRRPNLLRGPSCRSTMTSEAAGRVTRVWFVLSLELFSLSGAQSIGGRWNRGTTFLHMLHCLIDTFDLGLNVLLSGPLTRAGPRMHTDPHRLIREMKLAHPGDKKPPGRERRWLWLPSGGSSNRKIAAGCLAPAAAVGRPCARGRSFPHSCAST